MPAKAPLLDPSLTREQIIAEHVVGPPEPQPVRATGHCRHYGYEHTGVAGFLRCDHGGPTCAVGCDNRTEPGASNACMPESPRRTRTCRKREDYTQEEREAWQAHLSRHIRRSVVAQSAIPAEGSGGEVPCPACVTGTIAWARARINGHLHAACSTPGCFEVIQ